MKWSKTYLFTLKESPSDAEIISHKLLVRGGFIRKLSRGVFTYGFLFLKSLRKLEQIIREELNKTCCTEVLMPVLCPKELWEQSGRWNQMGKSLQKFKNRNDQEFCLGPTHEEVVTDYIRKDIKSFRDLPKTLYQIQNKVRDEIRPRFGLLRGREFVMKDAYSFDVNKKQALKSYERMRSSYKRIFDRIGFRYCIVRADSGAIGGDLSEEFHVLAETGEDEIFVSEDGSLAANREICPIFCHKEESSGEVLKEMEMFSTPGLKTIDDLAQSLNIPSSQLVKTLFYKIKNVPVCFLLRGSDELNEFKIKNFFQLSELPSLLEPDEIKTVTKGALEGSCGPVGLDIPIYCDQKLKNSKNFIVGANQNDFHYRNANFKRDFQVENWFDFCYVKENDLSETKSPLKKHKGIEVGHIFYLGDKYSKSMGAQFLSDKRETHNIEMGCYGIGVSRLIQATIEQSHDKDGMIWPLSLAPFDVHVCHLDPKDKQSSHVVENLYSILSQKGYECFIDDRDERPGVKFKDADLLGFPLRVNIGKRGLQKKEIECVIRATGKKQIVKLNKISEALENLLKHLK